METKGRRITRRQFVQRTAGAAFALTIVPRHVLGGPGYTAPSEKLNIACIGCGGKGDSDIHGVSSQNIVALCDVDWARAAGAFKRYPDVPKYKDFRVMLDKEKSIDAVTVSTPDHAHAPAALTAIQLGKHVYVQKPLTRTIYEARQVMEAAREHKVATQMGNQGHASDDTRKIVEWIRQGAIGQVREVHFWTNRPIWPQGIDRPTDTPPMPKDLDWNLWLCGRPYRPYNPAYVPFKWRGWWEFGCGALGDMGCHIMDAGFWALDLDEPLSVEAESSGFNTETFPHWSIITYEFPQRGDMAPAKAFWYDGGKFPPLPPELDELVQQQPDKKKFPLGDNGQMYIGAQGVMVAGPNGQSPRIFPKERSEAFFATGPKQTIPRVSGHYTEWIEACKGGQPASGNFDYAARLTKTVLLGNAALAARQKIYGTAAQRH